MPPFKGVKDIPIDHFYETKTEEGDTMLMAWGLDGIQYRLPVRSKSDVFIPIVVSDENLQGRKSDEDLTEPVEFVFRLRRFEVNNSLRLEDNNLYVFIAYEGVLVLLGTRCFPCQIYHSADS